MQKLTKNEFGLSSKHELWNRIKELEESLTSQNLTIICMNGDLDDMSLQISDLKGQILMLQAENDKLRYHNDYLLSQLSGYFKIS